MITNKTINNMSIKETRLIMAGCEQEFGYTPRTAAEFAAYLNYLEKRADEESAHNTSTQ